MSKACFVLLFLLGSLFYLTGCNTNETASYPTSPTSSTSLRIVAGSENKTLQPLFDRFAAENNVTLTVDYRGSVDIMLLLSSSQVEYDAVMPANSLWLTLGDKQKRTREMQSIYWSPVVLGVKESLAQQLGWVNKTEVRVEDILKASEAGKLRYMVTSATQSNSGASAYLGNLYAFAGKPQMLTSADLNKPSLQAKIKRLYSAVNRSAGSSGFLKDLFLNKYEQYDAMMNYEAVIIETNRELTAQGKEPLYVVYPSDGLAIADAPLAYVDQGNADTLVTFKKLQAFLLSEPIQKEVLALGRRIAPVGSGHQTPIKRSSIRLGVSA